VSDLVLPPGRGIPDGLVIPDAELVERFSRSSGPGGQSVNTTDSRVELRWDVAGSNALGEAQRARLLDRLGARLTDGAVTIVSSEHRSQLQNRTAARARLRMLLVDALAPPLADAPAIGSIVPVISTRWPTCGDSWVVDPDKV
jgi:ribosome-associated protein